MKLIYKIQIVLFGLMVASPTLYPMVRSWMGLTPGTYYQAMPIFAGMGILGLAWWTMQNFELKKK